MLKKLKWVKWILLLAVLLVLTMIALSLIPGRQPGRSMLAEVFDPRTPEVMVSELSFDVGRSRIFAHANGSVAAAGTLGIQALGPDGNETLRDSFRMSAPALIENNGRFLAFDIGGTSVRVFNSQEILSAIETEGMVVSASINGSGWFCIVTQERLGGSRGTVDVYNSNGRNVFRVIMGSGFVLSAMLSDDNTCLAIVNIAETGGRITMYDGIDADKDEPDRIYDFGGDILLSAQFLSDASMLAIGAQSVYAIDLSDNTPAKILYDFDEKRLGGYTFTEEFIALHLYDYSIGYSGQIVTLSFEGEILGLFETSLEVVSLDSCKNTLMLLYGDGIAFYTKNLEIYPYSYSTVSATTAGRVLALGETMALAASDLSAIVVRRDEH